MKDQEYTMKCAVMSAPKTDRQRTRTDNYIERECAKRRPLEQRMQTNGGQPAAKEAQIIAFHGGANERRNQFGSCSSARPELRTTRKSMRTEQAGKSRTVVSKNANERRRTRGVGKRQPANGPGIVLIISLRSKGAYLMIINVMAMFAFLRLRSLAGLGSFLRCCV